MHILGIHHIDSRVHNTQIDTLNLDPDIYKMALEERILCVPGVYIIHTTHNISVANGECLIYTWGILCVPGELSILAQITPHTARYIGPRIRYTMWTWGIHHTQTTQYTDKMNPEVGILCIPGVHIILTYSTQHTDKYNCPYGRYTMCTWSIHYAYPQYSPHC